MAATPIRSGLYLEDLFHGYNKAVRIEPMDDRNGLKYLQVRDLLVDQFRKDGYVPGTRISSELTLTRTLGVSRTTVRQALTMLERDGVVERRHGSGTFFIGHASRHPEQQPRGLIGMINFFYMDYIYPEIVRGIEDTVSRSGYYLILANCNMDHDKEIDSVMRLLDQGVKGLVLEPSQNVQITESHPMMQAIHDRRVPVITTHWGSAHRTISTVTTDDLWAGSAATTYLSERGHQRIGMIYKRDVEAGLLRFEGYRDALARAHIPFTSELVGWFTQDDEMADLKQGYILTQRLLSLPENRRPTAIFYFNDHTAQQGYSAIREAGLRIPEDISVIGFDNYQTAEMMHPPLTTFEHPKYQLGRWAAQLLLDAIDRGVEALPVKMTFEPRLVERRSVATIGRTTQRTPEHARYQR